MNNGLKIYIVDDHSLFREGLHFLLSNSQHISEIREAKNGKEFLSDVESYNPDVVLMDIEMPELNGIDTTKEALKILPDLKIVALSMHSDEIFYTEMIEAGAKGFLVKDSKFNDVESAILEAHNNRNFFSPEILSVIVKNLNRKQDSPNCQNLTEREQEVLVRICQGLSNPEIGKELHIAKRTVDKHRENILSKTQTNNTAELVVYAIKNKYFEI